MDSFDEFRQNINQKPENTRSSLIESKVTRTDAFSNENPTFDICRRQARSIEPADDDFEFERNKSSRAPLKTFTQSEQQDLSQYPSVRYMPQTHLAGVYDSSGKPLNLLDFRNDMDTELFIDSNNTATYGPPDSWFLQKNIASNLQKNKFTTYDESGRTFNLTEFARDNSNTLQHSAYTNDIQHLNSDTNYQRRTHKNPDNSKITFHHVPCESFKKSCCEFCHGSLRQQNECLAILKRGPQFQYGQNVEVKSTHLPLKPDKRKDCLFDTLVKDHYYPGTIVDTVNGLIDFNKIAFDAVFNDCEEIPLEINQESVPMTVLEAFSLRIRYEQDLRDDREGRKLFCANVSQTAENENNVQKEASESVKYWTHRDELKLASTIDIDLMTKVSNFPETPLREAINCLLKAEKMNNFDRNVHLAQEAIRTAEDGQHELAALKSTCSFKLDLSKDETKTTNTYEPLAIISYIGTTKPNTE